MASNIGAYRVKKSFVEYEVSVLQLRSAHQYRHASGEFASLQDFDYRKKSAKRAAETSKLSRFLLFKLIDGELS